MYACASSSKNTDYSAAIAYWTGIYNELSHYRDLLSGDVDNNVKLKVEKSLSRLESIIKSRTILSKSMLEKEVLNSSYETYVENCLSIVIDKSIEQNCIFRSEKYDRLPGERQVKDKVGIEYFNQ